MGKMKRRRGSSGRQQPTGILSQQQAAADNSQTTQTSRVGGVVSSLIEKLSSTHKEERGCACAMLAGLVEQPDAARQLLAAKVVKVIGPLLLDEDVSIQKSAAGALRNLSTIGFDHCDEMVKQDVLTSVQALLQKCCETDTDFKNTPHREILVNVVHLLWNLCESSDVAVEIFSRAGLTKLLFPLLDAHKSGADLAVAAAQCLYTVSEDNSEVSSQLCMSSPDTQSFLSAVLGATPEPAEHSAHALLKVLTTGLVYNVSPRGSTEHLANIVRVLVETLAENTDVILEELCRVITQRATAKANGCDKLADSEEMSAGDEPPAQRGHEVDLQVQDKQLESLSCSACDILAAQQVALEILANICCQGQEGADEWEDEGSVESFGDGSHSDGDMDVEEVMEQAVDVGLPSEVLSMFVAEGIIQKVLSKIEPQEKSILDTLATSTYGEKVLKSLCSVRERAMFCLSNMVTGMPEDALGGATNMQRVWTGLSTLITSLQACEVSLLEASTCAMRAVSQKLGQINPAAFNELSSSDLQFLVSLGRHESSWEIRTNVVNIMATMGKLVAQQQPTPQIIKDIGVFLLCTVHQDSLLWVQAEALDGIFDVFGEDHLDSVIQELGLIAKLQAVAPLLKTKVNQQRATLGEHLPIVMTAKTNLVRFIKYKTKHR